MRVVSLLRGINVGGYRKVRMVDLKAAYESVGLADVVTYIQSGNVVFTTPEKDFGRLKIRIQAVVEEQFGFTVPVTLRSGEEIAAVLADCPYGEVDLEREGTKIFVAFLSDEPDAEAVTTTTAAVEAPEELVVRGRHAYLRCPSGAGRSKLSPNFLEKGLAVDTTTRNWRTITKLHELTRQ